MLQCFLQSKYKAIHTGKRKPICTTNVAVRYSDILKEYEQQDNIFVYRFGLLLSAENEQAQLTPTPEIQRIQVVCISHTLS